MIQTRERYSAFTLTVHWLTAALVVTQFAIAWGTEGMEKPVRGFWMMGHMSIGLTILVITLVRLVVRLFHPALPLPAATPVWQKVAARGSHILLYILLIGMPLLGWIASTARQRPIQYFGLFTWPDLSFVPHERVIAKLVMGWHELGAWALIVIVSIHLLAAVKHGMIDKDGVLQRMLPFLPRRAA